MKPSLSCRTIREGLTEYLENALPGPSLQGFDEHLAACRDCRRLVDDVGAIVASMPHLQRETMPESVKSAIRKALPVRDVSHQEILRNRS